MKFLTKDIIRLYDTMNKISEREDSKNAPIDIKFLLVRNMRSLQPVWTDFIEARRELLITNSVPIEENSEDRRATSEQLEYINNEIAKLEKVEVEVAIAPISLAKLESLNLSVQEIDGLYPIITNGEAY